LVLDGVGKSFGGRAAIHDVSFAVRERELVALLGRSGSGKTTLLRCVSGLLQPDRGAVRVAGLDVSYLRGRERRRVAVIFQQFNLVGRISALANVLAGRLGHVPAWRGLARKFERADRMLALECLERVGLLEIAGQRADTLSGGQQQRVAIARALAQQPDIIVADEPVASLDPANSAGILDLLRGICRDQGVSVLCSLHQVHFARQFADRIVGLAEGRAVLDVAAAAFDQARATDLYGGMPEE
jgi:phosphonate transport system ATP-binding protein